MKAAPPSAIAELRTWPNWVGWRVEERDGKPTKVPVVATQPGRRASSTDSSTWSPYEAASRAVERGRVEGIGYVFSPEDTFVGIDLDHCVTPANGGRFAQAAGPTIHPAAQAIVDRLNSYTELSPSGTGLHIIVRGRITGKRNRTGGTPWGGEFESYDRGRFFTVTGNHLPGTPETIESRQEDLDAIRAELFPPDPKTNGVPKDVVATPTALDDVALLEKIRSSKQGPKFADLYDRGAPEGQESEADLALCNMLAFWIGPNEDRIDSVFRGSALMREKWDSPRGETTYGGYTIARALEGRTEFYGQKKTAPASAPARAEREHDDVEKDPADELAGFFGLIDDTFISGWRSSRRASCRVVLTTRGGLVFDVDSWKSATTSARSLSQEIRLQMGTDPSIGRENMARIDVLIGSYCKVIQTMTVQDRAVELGRTFLQEAETIDVDLDDQAARYAALRRLKDTNPKAKARADGTATVVACLVLRDGIGRRYVRISWFIDYVKENAVSSHVGAIVEAMESPGMWSRLNNSKSRMKGTDPVTREQVWQALYEVPAAWMQDDEVTR